MRVEKYCDSIEREGIKSVNNVWLTKEVAVKYISRI